ncbi:claudin-34-like [Nerophis ophidion]|uniref:claudin-34-like n=1 Tax=Nerophis ophidion TaxID=159077 RepID=UPI002AE0096E|nr:claudin-34-like [Nerophis ophidion]XP_061745296.1 claudin-34-like [Nerophis ophidion]
MTQTQLCALWLGCTGWILTAVALGLVQWRVWVVKDHKAISSGVAWVGLWRACFNSHTQVSPGFVVTHCSYISLLEASTPPEIVAGQVLMLLSVLVGLLANSSGVYALRNVHFGLQKNLPTCFFIPGAMFLSASGLSLLPLTWNLSSVVTNQTIGFPPAFKMPQAPHSQHVGCGITMGMAGTVLMIVSGIMFCRYGSPIPSLRDGSVGKDNPCFDEIS